MDLKNLVYGIYGLINYKRTDVFAEYEKFPLRITMIFILSQVLKISH